MKRLEKKQTSPEMAGVFPSAGGRGSIKRVRSAEDRIREAGGALDAVVPECFSALGDGGYRRRHHGGAE